MAAQAAGGNARTGEPVSDGQREVLTRAPPGSVCVGSKIVEEVLGE